MNNPLNGYTLFNSKLKNRFNGVFIKGDGTICSNDKVMLKLANFSVKLYELMTYFTKNDMQYLIEHFTYDEYMKLGGELYKLKLNPMVYPEYEQIRSVLKLTIELLYSYVIQYKKTEGLSSLRQKVDEQDRILNDIELLRDRINQLKKQGIVLILGFLLS